MRKSQQPALCNNRAKSPRQKNHGRPGHAEAPAQVLDVSSQVQGASCTLDERLELLGFICQISGRAHRGSSDFDSSFKDIPLIQYPPDAAQYNWEDCFGACQGKEKDLHIANGQISCCSFNKIETYSSVRQCNLYVSTKHVQRRSVGDRDMAERNRMDQNHVLYAQEIKHVGLSSPGERGHAVSSSGSVRQREEERKAAETELARIAEKERKHAEEKLRKQQSNLNTDTDAYITSDNRINSEQLHNGGKN